MKKKTREAFIFYNREKDVLESLKPEELPIQKSAILEKSIYFFDDPAPCFIHENAVIVRILEEIARFFQKKDEPIFIDALPEEIRGYLDLGKEVSFIEYCSYR